MIEGGSLQSIYEGLSNKEIKTFGALKNLTYNQELAK